MKKIISLMLVMTFILTGCSSNTNNGITLSEKESKKTGTYVEYASKVKDDTKILNYKKEIVKYSENDKISQALIDKQYYEVKKNGYSLYPNEKYSYPEYLNIDGELKIVFLKAEEIQSNVYYRPDIDNFSVSIQTDGWSQIYGMGSGNSKGSVINSFIDSANDLFTGSSAVKESASAEFNFPTSSGMLNTSEYNAVKESNFLSVATSPLSTFAADVDTASYTNFRNILRAFMSVDGNYYYNTDELHDVRIEEMLNYFNYDFEKSDDLFTINAEIADTPWNNETKLLVLNVAAKDLPEEENKGSNLVFLIDTSGSMYSYDKIDLVKESLSLLVDELTENDTISIVTYSGSSEVVLEGVSGDNKREILNAIEKLTTGGSTNGEGGMKKAYEIAEKYKKYHSNSRIIMCSDGDLNVGINSESELENFVSKKRETGIYLSVLGFGDGNYKDNKMETLADNGNGNYFYIDCLKEGYKVLVEDLMSTLITAADDVKFQIEFNPEYVKGYRKIGYENRNMANEDFHDDTKDGGEVGYGDSVTIVYEIVPADSNFEVAGSGLKYQTTTNTGSSDWMTVSVRYKDHGEKESKLIEEIIDKNNYSEVPSDNWKFISNVVGFGLILNDSEYKENLTINQIISAMNDLELDDKDKVELLSLVIGYSNYLDTYLD